MAYVGASVDEATKEKWEGYIEETDYGSLSELIRSAVRKEMQPGETNAASASREQTIEVDRLQEQQRTTLQRLEELREAVETAQEERKKTEYPEEVVDVAHTIAHEELDTLTPREYEERAEEANMELAQLADRYFGDHNETHRVRAALNYLEENIGWIRRNPARPSDYFRVED